MGISQASLVTALHPHPLPPASSHAPRSQFQPHPQSLRIQAGTSSRRSCSPSSSKGARWFPRSKRHVSLPSPLPLVHPAVLRPYPAILRPSDHLRIAFLASQVGPCLRAGEGWPSQAMWAMGWRVGGVISRCLRGRRPAERASDCQVGTGAAWSARVRHGFSGS